MANCSTCGNKLAFFETVKTIGGEKRCGQCNARFTQAKDHWLATLDSAFRQGGVPVDLEQAVYQNLQELRMPPDFGQPVQQRLQYLRMLSEIRWGHIPRISTNVHLDSDEYAHFAIHATYHKPASKQSKIIPGRLLGTNKKLYFFSNTGADSSTIDLNNVGMVEDTIIVENMTRRISTRMTNTGSQTITQPYQTRERGIRLTVSKGAGGGAYVVEDPFYTKIIIDTLVRLWKRQLVIYKEQAVHGAIPDHVKAAVFHRDKGTCVQCGYTGDYIEYDHCIPRSKGGQNTVENIQLLCRKCNLKKSDRV